MPDKHEVGGSTPLEPTTVNKVDSYTFARANVTVLRIDSNIIRRANKRMFIEN